jgi:hypothetical protein
MNLLKAFVQKWQSVPLAGSSRRGQSLVEIAIAFPFMLMLLSGMLEFGFMLNHYIALTDSTRETARVFSNFSPFNEDGTDNVVGFYANAAGYLVDNLEPQFAEDTSRRITLDSARDDVVISVFSIHNNAVIRFPDSLGGQYQWFGNLDSRFSNEEIESRLVAGAPDTGILLVEVFYNYDQVLALPWIQAFLPDPVTLHAYTIMPLSAAEPTPTPSP